MRRRESAEEGGFRAFWIENNEGRIEDVGGRGEGVAEGSGFVLKGRNKGCGDCGQFTKGKDERRRESSSRCEEGWCLVKKLTSRVCFNS